MLTYDVKFDTKDDSILQNSSQEPSTYSKYDCDLDALLIMLGSWYQHTAQWWHMLVICDVKFDTKYDHILQNSSQEPSTSSKRYCVLDALIIMLGSWKSE